tara:strand:+ start:2232 stop:2447 length:216 start_codon:yes stop_codon:yes gene_type:complete
MKVISKKPVIVVGIVWKRKLPIPINPIKELKMTEYFSPLYLFSIKIDIIIKAKFVILFKGSESIPWAVLSQ